MVSDNRGTDYSVNWMAVTSNPDYHEGHVDLALEKMKELFPQEYAAMKVHTAGFKDTILTGADPTSEMKGIEAPNTPAVPVSPNEGELHKFELDLATVVVDSISLILSFIDIGIKAKDAWAKTAYKEIAPLLKAETVPTNIINEIRKDAALLRSASSLSAKAKIVAKTVNKIAKIVTSIGGLLKKVLHLIKDSMSFWEWILTAIKISTQLIVMAAAAIGTAGLALAAEIASWVSRIVKMVEAVKKLAGNIVAFAHDVEHMELNTGPG